MKHAIGQYCQIFSINLFYKVFINQLFRKNVHTNQNLSPYNQLIYLSSNGTVLVKYNKNFVKASEIMRIKRDRLTFLFYLNGTDDFGVAKERINL